MFNEKEPKKRKDHSLRLFEVMKLVQSGRLNADAIAKECKCSRRTAIRCINKLRKAGLAVVYDKAQQRYLIKNPLSLPPTQFTQDEAIAIVTLCLELNEAGQLPYMQAARSAALKLMDAMPAKLLQSINSVGAALKIRLKNGAVSTASGQTVFEQLLMSYNERRAIRIIYKSPSEDEPMLTLLCPYQIIFCRNSWYVIGRSSIHRSARTFRVDRIQKLEVSETKYEIPSGFSLETYFRNAWSMIPEPGADVDVVVRFSKRVATNISEVAWHQTQRIITNPDGTIDFHTTVSGINEIAYWILGYGKEAKVLQPSKLQNLVAHNLREALKQYE